MKLNDGWAATGKVTIVPFDKVADFLARLRLHSAPKPR